MVAFIEHEIELLQKKSDNRKPTKTQEENKSLKNEILSVLSDEGMTVTEIQKKSEILGAVSNQKVSALLRQLVEVGAVEKTVEKKKSFFSRPTRRMFIAD
jgi:DNA-binding PadR family transcriptional regulator